MHINIQPAEKQNLSAPLQVHSIFYTIQGEGPFCGHPAVFVRLAGCNLQCPKCDTEYTNKRIEMTDEDIVRSVRAEYQQYVGNLEDENLIPPDPVLQHNNPRPIVVISGGEPFRQNIARLVRILASQGYRVQIETNGTLYVDDLPWDSVTIVCSPKAGKINPKLLPRIDAFKYVMSADSVDTDGLPKFALDHTAAPRVARPPLDNTKPVYLQPLDDKDERKNWRNTRACVHSCMRFGYILQLQVHKIIDVE